MSEQVKHTPGPWHFVESNVGATLDHGYGILHGSPGIGGWEEDTFIHVGCSHRAERALGAGVPEANARLISAAPDLLAALRRIADSIGWRSTQGDDPNLYYCEFCGGAHPDWRLVPHHDECPVSSIRAAIAKAEGDA